MLFTLDPRRSALPERAAIRIESVSVSYTLVGNLEPMPSARFRLFGHTQNNHVPPREGLKLGHFRVETK